MLLLVRQEQERVITHSVLQKYGIRYIIDDAILIRDNKVIAGKSAKTEASKIASVKAAIILDESRKSKWLIL